jgi:hypothetical protein
MLCAAFVLQVHLFSGGGFIFMGWVFQILAELEPHNTQAADVRARICGVVFDSSPADVTAGWYLLLELKMWHDGGLWSMQLTVLKVVGGRM